jgi:signal transduction histidine kinase
LQAGEASRQFVPRLIHELRNPLDGMRRFLSLALREDCAPEQRERYLAVCRQGVERLVDIVDSLAGCYPRGASCPAGVADVTELVCQAVQFQEAKAERLGVCLHVSLDESVPPARCGAGLFQVFCNLITNACDAMAEAGGALTVSTQVEDGHVAIRFADTGPGIPSDVVEHIFTPFFTTKLPGKGMGLGLAVCQEIVSRLEGRIEVESEPGRGTTFVVVVPCAAGE